MMNMHHIHRLFLLFTIGLPLVCSSTPAIVTVNSNNNNSNNSSSSSSGGIATTIHHSHDNENTTHGQLSQSLNTLAACVLPHCYDIINDTVATANKDHLAADEIARNSANTKANNNYETWLANNDGSDAGSATATATASPTINIDDQHWASSSVMYGLLTHNTKDYVNEQCYGELRQIYNGIRRKEIWAIKGQ